MFIATLLGEKRCSMFVYNVGGGGLFHLDGSSHRRNWIIFVQFLTSSRVDITCGEIGEKEEKEVLSVKLERKKKKREETCQLNLGGKVLGILKRGGWRMNGILFGSYHPVDPIWTTIEIEQEIEKKSERVQNKGEGGVGGWIWISCAIKIYVRLPGWIKV